MRDRILLRIADVEGRFLCAFTPLREAILERSRWEGAF